MSARTDDVTAPPPVRPRELRAALGHFATGVTVVTAIDPTCRVHGTTANAVASVSLEPPLVLICLSNESQTGAAALATRRFAVNVLRHDQRALATRFARKTGEDAWSGVRSRPGAATPAPLLADAVATLECAVHDVADGGDHRIIIGHVLAVEYPVEHVDPLLFYRAGFHALPAPTPPDSPSRPTAPPEIGLPSAFGDLRIIGVGHDAQHHHASLVALVGTPRGTTGSLAYVHLGCVLGDALGHIGCRRRTALHAAIDAMRDDGRGLIVYHRDGGSPFAGCCVGNEPLAVDRTAVVAIRRTVEQLAIRRARLLVDPYERERLAPADLGLDVASTIELESPAGQSV